MSYKFSLQFFRPLVGIGWLDDVFFASFWVVCLTITKV
jgi:hypothetical protein